ncbi:PucR C-terminal helix-turn-helix domain-containing protein [Caloramator fervidus]|uniref:PucR C-terminal helix-turn-helix domain-containing protein n=1 Tax=Caloramator fervidus TaxID=29344 RepID=A0A1H5UVV0_9CLOT|nr:helix-turn-helix domain-containing protein [Caloramator fervidus]SEF79110.1 PucR C-terminal helix-turn-helix domain-containing protein [Caloramator fervidus]
MSLCDTLQNILKYEMGLYDLNGNLKEGKDVGLKNDEFTYIKLGEDILAIKGKLSRDACNLIEFYYNSFYKKEAADTLQPLEHILKNDVPNESLVGKFINKSVMYIMCPLKCVDILKSIYEGCKVDLVEDEEGFYIVKEVENFEEEAQSIIDELKQEGFSNILIGCGRAVKGSYTIKNSAVHAKISCFLAKNLGYNEGLFHIDKMILYGIISESDASKIDFYLNGGYDGFYYVYKDKELINTAEVLFRCHLNISEASRRLYLHRNTLLYRVEKIKNLTGLDIKKFEEAMVFKTVIAIFNLKGK